MRPFAYRQTHKHTWTKPLLLQQGSEKNIKQQHTLFTFYCLLSQLSGNGVWKSPIIHYKNVIRWKQPEKLLSIISLKLQWFAPIFWLPPIIPPLTRCVHRPWQIYFKGSLCHDPFFFSTGPPRAAILSNKAQSWSFPTSLCVLKAAKAKGRVHSGELQQLHQADLELITSNVANVISWKIRPP